MLAAPPVAPSGEKDEDKSAALPSDDKTTVDAVEVKSEPNGSSKKRKKHEGETTEERAERKRRKKEKKEKKLKQKGKEKDVEDDSD